MPCSQYRDASLRNCSDGQQGGPEPDKTPYQADTAALTLADTGGGRSHCWDVPAQDPFTYYKAFMSSDASYDGRANMSSSHHDSSAEDVAVSTVQLVQGVGGQHCNTRADPYHVAVRFATRSNGAPLATIIEQRSVSTLNSRGSLISVGRYPSVRTADDISHGRAAHRIIKGLDDNALKNIEEEPREEIGMHTAVKTPSWKFQRDRDATDPSHILPVPSFTASRRPQGSDAHQTHCVERPLNSKGLKSLLRDALHNIRGGSRTRSRSSSMTEATSSHCGEERPDSHPVSPQTQGRNGKSENTPPDGQALAASAIVRDLHLDFTLTPGGIEPQSINGTSSDRRPESSAGVHPPIAHLSPPTSDSNAGSSLIPHRLSIDGLSHPGDVLKTASSVRPVLPEPRDVAQDHVHVGAATLYPRIKDELSVRDALHAAPTNRNDATFVRDYDRARNTSRNASFCSMSTSYSGTVLGVDLDLQHEFVQPARRPVTPVWFTSKECVNLSLDPKHQQAEAGQLRPRSMTSSALSALLPIAAAEGIVQSNPMTPLLSFFSPSGNLIQAESSSPLSTDTSGLNLYSSGPSATTTSFYSNSQVPTAYNALSASMGLPPIRPAPVPMATPPQSFAPLPEHLRHHHNYRHAESSRITPESTNTSVTAISPGPTVKGCGGVIRPESLITCSETPRALGTTGRRPSHDRSVSCLFTSDMTRSRFNFLTSRPTFKKDRMKMSARPPASENGIGQAAGHAMRVCFCQPYDGAGQKTLMSGRRSMSHCHDETSARQARDTESPNVRIVDDGGGNKSIGPRTRARSDSGFSTGTSIRVCVVGA